MKGKIYWPSFHRSDWFSFKTNHNLIRRASLCGIKGGQMYQVRRCPISVGFNNLFLTVHWRRISIGTIFSVRISFWHHCWIKHRDTSIGKAEKPNGSLENQVEFERVVITTWHFGFLRLRQNSKKNNTHINKEMGFTSRPEVLQLGSTEVFSTFFFFFLFIWNYYWCRYLQLPEWRSTDPTEAHQQNHTLHFKWRLHLCFTQR